MAQANTVLAIRRCLRDPWNKLGILFPGNASTSRVPVAKVIHSIELNRTNLRSVYTHACLHTSTHMDSEEHMDSYVNDPSLYLCGIISVHTCFYLWRKIIESHHYKESTLSSHPLVALRSTKVHTRQPPYKNLTQLL